MTGRTSYTGVDNSGAMQGPAQITAVYEHFDSLIGESEPSASALPMSGNWPGRMISVEDTGAIYLWVSGAWVAAVLPDTGWITPTLGAGWSVNSVAPRYRRRNGVVYFKGRANSSGATGVAFIVQAGFFPDDVRVQTLDANGTPTRAQVSLTGGVGQPTAGAIVALSFDGITPYVAAL